MARKPFVLKGKYNIIRQRLGELKKEELRKAQEKL